jgi:hypothetical protein
MGVTFSSFLCREISASVGPAMTNERSDILTVQKQLNAHLPKLQPAQATVSESGTLDNATSQAIIAFQRVGMKHTTPSGRVHPRGPTMVALNEMPGSAAVGTSRKPAANATISEYLGALGLRHFTSDTYVRKMSQTSRFTPVSTNPHHKGLPSIRATNIAPPRNIWDNIIPTLLVLDEICEELSYDLTLLNSYRSKAYNDEKIRISKAKRVVADRIKAADAGTVSTMTMSNAKSGVAAKSQHMPFRAIDWNGSGGAVGLWHDKAKGMRGRRFALPWPISMNNVTIAGAAGIKFNESALLLTDGDFEFHGGIGLYPRFIHIDCRGIDKSWTGH